MISLSRPAVVTASVPALGSLMAGLVAAGVAAVLPAPLLEGFAVDSGLSAVLPAAAPPLGLTARAVLALIGGGVAAALGWAALYLLFGPDGLLARKPAVGTPSVRRADAHPDAPPRRPLSAAELDSPPVDLRPIERPLPTDLDQPLSAFDPYALARPAPTSPLADVRPPVEVDQPDAVVAAPRIRLGAVQPNEAELVQAPPSIETLLARLERSASRRVAMP